MQIIQEKQRNEMSCRTWTFDKSPHGLKWHKNCEMLCIISRKCSFLIDDEIVHAKKGDIVFINEHIPHKFIIEESDTQIRLTIFDIKSVLNPNVRFVPLKRHITSEEISQVDGLKNKLDTIFNLIEQEGESEKIKDNPVMQMLIAAIYFILMRYFPATGERHLKKQIADFYEVVEFINEHFEENINVKILARKFCMSRERLSAIFVKYADMRVNDYIDNLRINKANKMLLGGSRIAEAAMECGFQSIRTFNSTYKRIVGLSPSEFIKENSNKKVE